MGLVALAFVMIIGSLSSTADSDLAALSSIVMTDVYGQSVGRKNANPPKLMLLIGRITMIVATGLALYFATAKFNILDLLVFVGALWGCLVFPVIASFYWKKVTNLAFSVSVLAALAIFLPVRFQWIPLTGGWALFVELLAVLGVGVVLGSWPSASSVFARRSSSARSRRWLPCPSASSRCATTRPSPAPSSPTPSPSWSAT